MSPPPSWDDPGPRPRGAMHYPGEGRTCSICARGGRARVPATWAVVGGQWPGSEEETELPFQRERRLAGQAMAWLCDEHASVWTTSWGLGIKQLGTEAEELASVPRQRGQSETHIQEVR